MLNKLLPHLIATYILLTLTLFWATRTQPPGPISNFNVARVHSAKLYAYPPGMDIEMEHPDGTPVVPNTDSLALEKTASREVLKVMLSGLHYETAAYDRYHGIERDIYSMVLCHDPHFSLKFFDEAGNRTNAFSVCFACNNVRFSNGFPYRSSGDYNITEEGRAAFLALQERYFPDFHAAYLDGLR